MGRLIGIDYGKKRTGLAWSDPLQIIATGLETIETIRLRDRLRELHNKEQLSAFVLGYPQQDDGSDTHITADVRSLQHWLLREFPSVPVHLWDEAFTSVEARRIMVQGGVSKKRRNDKNLINEVSAILILKAFMESR